MPLPRLFFQFHAFRIDQTLRVNVNCHFNPPDPSPFPFLFFSSSFRFPFPFPFSTLFPFAYKRHATLDYPQVILIRDDESSASLI